MKITEKTVDMVVDSQSSRDVVDALVNLLDGEILPDDLSRDNYKLARELGFIQTAHRHLLEPDGDLETEALFLLLDAGQLGKEGQDYDEDEEGLPLFATASRADEARHLVTAMAGKLEMGQE